MRAFVAPLVVAAGVLVAAQQTPQLPAPFATASANNFPRVVDPPPGAKLQAPQGFSVDMWAAGFDMPRFMLLAPGGEILLSDSGAGNVYVFAGGNGANRKMLISGLSRPFGLAFWQNYLYVAETNSVKRYPYDAKALTAGPGQEVVKVPGGGNHWTRAIVFDRAGQKMYVSVGSSSNIEPDPEARAAINRYNPDGSGHEIYAAGTRNPSNIHWYPNSDTLWTTVI
jgi:glucose/arabinose dehydrogenase